MDEVKLLIQSARNERESGDLNKSLQMFLEIDQSKFNENQIYDFLGELGLTYFHLKDFENSKITFEKALNKAREENKETYQALFLRHLVKKEFNNNPEELTQKAITARELAEKSGRKDLVWFDQGVISALFNSNASKEDFQKWFEIESEDLLKASKEVKDEIALWVWVTGMLLEKYDFDKDKSHLNLALILAEKYNLERRKDQIYERKK